MTPDNRPIQDNEKEAGVNASTSLEKYSPEVIGETLLGSDATISPRLNAKGRVEGYDVTLVRHNGNNMTFYLSKEKGDELIEARVAAMSVTMQSGVDEEALQSLFPTLVADRYRQLLIQRGTPTDQIPDTTTKMIAMAQEELIAYRELGKEQIKSAAQRQVDRLFEITNDVLHGNRIVYDGLPKPFQRLVDSQIPLLQALAIENSGITEETLEAQKIAFKITLLTKEESYSAFLNAMREGSSALADTISGFVGTLIGTAGGAVTGSFERARLESKNKPKGQK